MIFQGKKSLSYSITRWQLASVIVILWGFIYHSTILYWMIFNLGTTKLLGLISLALSTIILLTNTVLISFIYHIISKNRFKKMYYFIPIIHLNADEIRKHFNDWDFSKEGRLRQADRMKRFSDYIYLQKISPLADFVCPLDETRNILNPDIIIWMDTEKKGRFENTNKIFQKPKKFHFRITTKNAKYWSNFIKERIINNDY